jgi:hypothetical protein
MAGSVAAGRVPAMGIHSMQSCSESLTVLHCSMLIISTVTFLPFLDRFGCYGRSTFLIQCTTYTISAWEWEKGAVKRTAAPFRMSLGNHISRSIHLHKRFI